MTDRKTFSGFIAIYPLLTLPQMLYSDKKVMKFKDPLHQKIYEDLFEFDAKQDAEENSSLDEPDESSLAGGFSPRDFGDDEEMTERAFRENLAAKFNTLEAMIDVVCRKIKQLEDRQIIMARKLKAKMSKKSSFEIDGVEM